MKKKKKLSFQKILISVLCVCIFTAFGGMLLRCDLQSEAPKRENEPKRSASLSYEDGDIHSGRIDLNYADMNELMSLPGIGKGYAGKIIAYREERPFRVPRDIKKIKGIGDKTYENLKDLICVGEEIELY